MMSTVALLFYLPLFLCLIHVSSFSPLTTRRVHSVEEEIPVSKCSTSTVPHTTIRTIDLFLTDNESQVLQAEKELILWFDRFIKSSDYFKRKVDEFSHSAGAFHVPAFNTTISLNKTSASKYTITSEGNKDGGYGLLIAKIFESQKKLKHIDNSNLRQAVKQYFEFIKPTTGIDASIMANPWVDQHFSKSILNELKHKGFISLDTDLFSTQRQRGSLSSLFQCNNDSVATLSQDEAYKTGVKEPFDFLMGIAHYLNWNMEWDGSVYEPLPPATKMKPLTNPSTVEITEYGQDQYRNAKSDNALLDSNTRKNYRMYTCILCCSDNWNSSKDGGAIRIYPNTSNVSNPDKALSMQYEDIRPTNGKLIIIDSRLVYSIETVKSNDMTLRTMTLWISKPENNGVGINIWDDNKGRVHWHRMH